MKSQTHKQLKPLIIAALLSCSIYTGTASAQVPTGDYSHIGLQVVQWAQNYNQWIKNFRQNIFAQVDSLLGTIGLDSNFNAIQTNEDRKKKYQAFADDFAKDQRCSRMSSTSQAMAKTLCTDRHSFEVQKLQAFVHMLDVTDSVNQQIKGTMRKLNNVDRTNDPKQAEALLSQLAAQQKELSNKLDAEQKNISMYDQQIAMLKQQQAEVARIALSGRVKTVVEAATDAGIQYGLLKAAFAIK